ncbi:DUF998 domain-containing protein [Maritimibacter sp. HL-12]|uniref:DUF998 domain-containing protein n=1 Tax=Maritimibacter sp. HL-12 TaxID=1162418 RepID=UPI000A0F001F|nr:DUF998 domain-containing protein [Maritimibacter sp. HL-12]SMH48757.1 Protein of unknown function [Maritimibacter sp. HL-12]
MSIRHLYTAGILAPFVYLFTVLIGGRLQPDHAHLSDPVSLLGAPGSAGLAWVVGGWTATGLLYALMGVGLWRDPAGLGRRVAALIVATGLIMAVIALAFPMDPPGAPLSGIGLGHIVLVGASAVLLIAAIILSARRAPSRFERRAGIGGLGLMLAGGIGAGAAAAASVPLVGLFEIVTQTGYHLWLFALAVAGWKRTSARSAPLEVQKRPGQS